MDRMARGMILTCLTIAFVHHMVAQLPQARLDTLFPPGGSQGSSLELTVTGDHLDGLSNLLFSHPGIQSEPHPSEPYPSARPVSIRVSIAPEVPPGIYEAHTHGYFGISNPRSFVVSPVNECLKEGKPHQRRNAMELTPGTIVNAFTEERSVDHYSILLKKGNSYTIECMADAIDSRLEPVITVEEAIGREIARVQNRGVLHFTAQSDGRHWILVHDGQYLGGPEYFYRLRLHDDPWVETILRRDAMPGTPDIHTLYGYRLKEGGDWPAAKYFADGLQLLDIQIPSIATASQLSHPNRSYPARPGDVLAGHFRWQWQNQAVDIPSLKPNGSTLKELRERPMASDTIQRITPPCIVGGHFFPSLDVDWFEFSADKGEVWWIEVFSDRLGHPTSPFLLIQRVEEQTDGTWLHHDIKEVYSKREYPLGRGVDLNHRDVDYRFEAPVDGTYQLRLSDLFQQSGIPAPQAYRLVIRKPSPDFGLVLAPSSFKPVEGNVRAVEPMETLLRKGMSWPLRVAAFRRDGFDNPITLSVEGLPAGVHCSESMIRKGERSGWLFLTAETNAPPGWAAPRIIGTSHREGKSIKRKARSTTTVWTVSDFNNQPLIQRLTSNNWLAVHPDELAPIIITPPKAPIIAQPNTSIEIPLSILWAEGTKEPIKLRPVGEPLLAKTAELEIKHAQTHALLTLNLAEIKPPPGMLHFALRGKVKVSYRNQPGAASHLEAQLQDFNARLAQAKAQLETSREAITKAKSENDSKASEITLSQAKERLKNAEKAQIAATRQAKEAVERAKPRDLEITVHSGPITVEIIPPQDEEAEP
ncbi:hypothetical protein OAE97_00655 [Verrucomicrobia bacterium]|nr:hypothetical protein [Verrucomicrobiota bacterium]